MYQYRIVKLLKIKNSDTLTVQLDVGFDILIERTFKVARVEVPELDLLSDDDPELELRRSIIQWFKTAPTPWLVQMYKENGVYTGDVIDGNGNVLTSDITPDETLPVVSPFRGSDDTQIVNYASQSPS